MSINRRTVTVGLATLALLGVTGGGIAWAAADGNGPYGSSSFGCPGGGYGMFYGDDSPMAAAADYLGLSGDELSDQLRSGSTLREIAEAQDKSVDGLKTAMLDAMKENLADNTRLTDAQRTAILERMSSRIDAMIDGTYGYGMDWDDMGPGMMGGGGWGSGGGWGPGGGMMGRW